MYFNICTRFSGFLTEPALHFAFSPGKFLQSSLEMSSKNLEIVKSRCHNCLEHSERRKRSSPKKPDSLPQRNLYKSCEPQVPTEMHHLVRINRSQMHKIFASFRNLISSISSSNLAYSLRRGSNVTCFFHLLHSEEISSIHKDEGVFDLSPLHTEVSHTFQSLQIWLCGKEWFILE